VLDPALRQPARFAALPSTPSSERVFALLLAEGTTVRQVEEQLRRSGGPLLEAVTIESDYRGPELPSGARSVAFRLTFRATDRTLRDSEIDAIETRMLATLAAELRIQRRVAGPSGGGE
jgi:phenylalanyl-tRNA synthetase beta chain